jgi:hypothetical protein
VLIVKQPVAPETPAETDAADDASA